MKRLILLAFAALAACDAPSLQGLFTPVTAPTAAPVPTLDPTPPPPPPSDARTVDQFDTTTEEDRQAALSAPAPAAEQALGVTNASLGSPTDPGIWLKTALVSELTPGRVENPANGQSVSLELRPSGGAAGSASQLSLAAMRLLGIPLTELADVKVYAN